MEMAPLINAESRIYVMRCYSDEADLQKLEMSQ
jgi:hypothetical protein